MLRIWRRPTIWLMLLPLCGVPSAAKAFSGLCPRTTPTTLFLNATPTAAQFLLGLEFSDPTTVFPVTVAWTPPSGPPTQAVLSGNGVLSLAVAPGAAITYACSGTGGISFQESRGGVGSDFDCTATPTGTLFQERAGVASNVLFSVLVGTSVPLTITYTNSSGQSQSAQVGAHSSMDGFFNLGAGSTVTYSCPGAVDDGLSLFTFGTV